MAFNLKLTTEQIQTEHGKFFQDTTPLSQSEGRTPIFAALQISQQPSTGQSFSIPIHPTPRMNHNYCSSPTLGVDYSEMSMDQGGGSFAAFQSCRSSVPLSTVQGMLPSNTSTTENCYDDNSIDTTYSGPAASITCPSNAFKPIETKSIDVHDGGESTWCLNGSQARTNNTQTNMSISSGCYGFSVLHNGLPRPQNEQPSPSFDEIWNTSYPVPFVPDTIKPKALNLNASFTSTVSMDSIVTIASSQTSTSSSTEFTAVTSSSDDTSRPPSPEHKSVLKQIVQPRTRQMLPSSRPIKSGYGTHPGLPSGRMISDRPRSSPNDRTVKPRRLKANAPISSAALNTRSHTNIKNDLDIRNNTVPSMRQDHTFPSKPRDPQVSTRSEQNKFLVNSRRAGMTYKAIRSKGEFIEAESTLRGRFRNLTKDKKDRVRKPAWTDDDVCVSSDIKMTMTLTPLLVTSPCDCRKKV